MSSPKRQCVGAQHNKDGMDTMNLFKMQKEIDNLDSIQEDLEHLDEQLALEIMELENKYEALRRPHLKKRQEVIARIPDFWTQVLTRHKLVRHMVDEEDKKMLKYLISLQVLVVDVKKGFRIEMHFKPNPYFTDTLLWKDLHYGVNGDNKISASGVHWKESTASTRLNPSFLDLFNQDDRDQEVAEVIREEVWKNPLALYMNVETYDSEEELFDNVEEEDDDFEEHSDEKSY